MKQELLGFDFNSFTLTSSFLTCTLSFNFRLAETYRTDGTSKLQSERFQETEVKDPFEEKNVFHHHGLPRGEVWQQHVILHDVAGHLPEGPQVPRTTIHHDLALHAGLPVWSKNEDY